jgi:hypothetical protein
VSCAHRRESGLYRAEEGSEERRDQAGSAAATVAGVWVERASMRAWGSCGPHGAIVTIITVGAFGTFGTVTATGTEGAELAPACTVSIS